MKHTRTAYLLGLAAIGLFLVGVAPHASAQTYIYANGGGYWKQSPATGSYWYTISGQGYCGKWASWCGPNYVRWTPNTQNTVSYWGEWHVWVPEKWQSYSTGYAFIPSAGATTRKATYYNYYIFYSGSSCHGTRAYNPPDNPNHFISYIDQLAYSDVWVRLWTPTSAMKCVDLVDKTGEPANWYKVGFDEIKVQY